MRLKPILISLAACIGVALPSYAGTGAAKLQNNDRVVFYGDSITFLGVHDPVYNGWFNQFQQTVGNAMPITLINSGIGGLTTTTGVTHLSKSVLSLNPSVVVIWLGINDVDTFTNFEITKQNIQYMVDGALANGAREVVLVSPMGHGEKQDGGNPTYDRAIDIIASYMYYLALNDKTNSVFYLPMRTYYLNEENAINPLGESGVLMRPDGVHPNGLGHLFIDQAFLAGFGLRADGTPRPPEPLPSNGPPTPGQPSAN